MYLNISWICDLLQTEDLINAYDKSGVPVAAVIIEPIQAEGGKT